MRQTYEELEIGTQVRIRGIDVPCTLTGKEEEQLCVDYDFWYDVEFPERRESVKVPYTSYEYTCIREPVMFLRESVSCELVGLMKAHGVIPMKESEYEDSADLICAELISTKGEIRDWLFEEYGHTPQTQNLLGALRGYWQNWLQRTTVI